MTVDTSEALGVEGGYHGGGGGECERGAQVHIVVV